MGHVPPQAPPRRLETDNPWKVCDYCNRYQKAQDNGMCYGCGAPLPLVSRLKKAFPTIQYVASS